MSPAEDNLDELLELGLATRHGRSQVSDIKTKHNDKDKESKVARRADASTDMFNLTDDGRQAVQALQSYSDPKPLPSLRLPGSEHQELEEQHMFTLLQKLLHERWVVREKQRRERAPAYSKNAEKIIWFSASSAWGHLSPPYLICLLKANSLLDSGLDTLHHFQIQKYYECILKIPPSKLKDVRPRQPTSFYVILMNGGGGARARHKKHSAPAELQLDAEESMLQPRAAPKAKVHAQAAAKVQQRSASSSSRSDSEMKNDEAAAAATEEEVDLPAHAGSSQDHMVMEAAGAGAQQSTRHGQQQRSSRAAAAVMRHGRGEGELSRSSKHNPTTIWVGRVPIVLRQDRDVPRLHDCMGLVLH